MRRKGMLLRMLTVTALCVLLQQVGCSLSPKRGENVHLIPREEKRESMYEIRGDLTLIQLVRLLEEEYGLRVRLDPEIDGSAVALDGELTETELWKQVESQAQCQVLRIGKTIEIIKEGDEFLLPVPAIELDGLPGVESRNVGGRGFVTGDYEELPRLRRAMDIVGTPRDVVRVRVVIVDENSELNGSLGFTDPFVVSYNRGVIATWSTDIVVNALYSVGAIKRDYDIVLIDGVEHQYRDGSERRLPTSTVIQGGQGQTSGYEVVSAGFNVTLNAVQLSRCWRLTGQVEVSDFVGGDGASKVQRTIPIEIDLAEGSFMRLCRYRTDQESQGGGVDGNLPRWLGSKGYSINAIWIGIESVDNYNRALKG